LAAQSFVSLSFEQPILTSEVNAMGVVKILESIRAVDPEIRFYQASTSEMFGNALETPQTETTPFNPRSPYGAAKLYGHCVTVNYREAYKIFAVSGILFNHESKLRGIEYVTRKVTSEFAKILLNRAECLTLGNLNAARDWGHAADYMRGVWWMMQQEEADDYILASGKTRTIREFVTVAANVAGFDLEWSGDGVSEKAEDRNSGKTIVRVDAKFYRPTEVNVVIGDPSKAREKLNWNCEHNFEKLVADMFKADLDRLENGCGIF
jgi:GDPmannose 4,6-dehydratase